MTDRSRQAIFFLFILLIGTSSCHSDYKNRITQFEKITAFSLPRKINIERTDNSNTDRSVLGPGEGEFYLVIRTEKKYLTSLLSKPAPFGNQWTNGPVPGEYGFFVSFGYNNEGYGKGKYFGSPELVEILSSHNIYYCADGQNRKPGGFFRNGHLIIIDPENNRLWFSRWDT